MNSSLDAGSSTIRCVVLNWNGASDTVRCVSSLLSSEGVALDVAIIDNGSTDDSVAILRERFPLMTVIRQTSNSGVARGFNVGIGWALANRHSLVFFLNNDATVDKNCLRVLKHVLDTNEGAGVVSPRIFDRTKPGRLWFDGGRVNCVGDPVHVGMSSPARKVEEREQDFATACAMLVRPEVFADAGRFDESFFAYSEDVDFCLRARAHGWKILHVPEAIVTHAPSSAVKKNRGKWFRDYYVTRNKLLLLRKRVTGLRWALFLAYSRSARPARADAARRGTASRTAQRTRRSPSSNCRPRRTPRS